MLYMESLWASLMSILTMLGVLLVVGLGGGPGDREASSRQTASSGPHQGGLGKPGAPFRPPRRKMADIVGARASKSPPPAAPETAAAPFGRAVSACGISLGSTFWGSGPES